jgi:hypothetical protein
MIYGRIILNDKFGRMLVKYFLQGSILAFTGETKENHEHS